MKLLMAEDLEKDSKTAKKERFDFAAYNHMLNCKQYENAAELLMDYGSRCIKAKADVYGLKKSDEEYDLSFYGISGITGQ